MKYDLERGRHSVYSIQYHLVQCVKYRRNVIDNEKIIDDLKTIFRKISEKFEVEILNMEPDKDHIHVLFKAKPTLRLTEYINTLKTISSRELKRKNPEIKKRLKGEALWSPSYFIATTGQVTIEQLKKYVENQGK